jgi:Adenylylsulphate kinase
MATDGARGSKILIMGLPGAGKTTLATALAPLLNAVVFNADAVRANLSRDLGFTHADRIEHARRMGWMCDRVVEAGGTVVAAMRERLRPSARPKELQAKSTTVRHVNPALITVQCMRIRLLRCGSPLVALSRHTDTTCFLSAFGAKRTCAVVWLRPPRSRMTHLGNRPPRPTANRLQIAASRMLCAASIRYRKAP